MRKPLTSLTIAAAALVLQGSAAALAQEAPPAQVYPFGWHMMWGWQGAVLGPAFMILVIAAVAALVAVLLRRPIGPAFAPPSGRAPLDILKERFARGEIDKAEYDERRRVLSD
jgi:putative membrane protein